MRIMVTHIPNTFNYGSAMMAVNLLYYLDKATNHICEFYTDARTEEDLNNLRTWTGNANIYVNKAIPISKKPKLKSLNLDLSWVDEYCEGIVETYDYYIVLGGDDLSEYYSKEIVVNELYKLDKIAKKIPVVLVGQTIGPFSEWRIDYAAEKLRNCKIYTRDSVTYDYLIKTLGLKNVEKSADLAFLELPRQEVFNTNDLLNKYKLEKEKYITLVPSGLVRLYTDNYQSYIDCWVDIVNYLIEHFSYQIVLLPHVVRPKEDDDNTVIKEMMNKIKSTYLDRVTYIQDDFSPLEARILFGNGQFVVTGRMHPAVSTIFMKKNVISLSYSVKYKAILGEELGCHDTIIECGHNAKWDTQELTDEVISKINYLNNNSEELQKRTNNYGDIYYAKTRKLIDEISKELIQVQMNKEVINEKNSFR